MRLLLVLALILVMLPAAHAASVCGAGCDYTSIAEAVQAATAGETITVKGGSYTENVVVNKSVTIVGEGSVTVAPASSRLPTFLIVSDGVRLRNLIIQGGGKNCVEVWNSSSVEVTGSTLQDCFVGVEAFASSVVVKNTDIPSPSCGIEAKRSSLVAEGVTISSPKVVGVLLRNSTGCTITKVSATLPKTATALYLINSDNNILTELTLSGGDVGVTLDSSSGNLIASSRISGFNEGIELIGSDSNEITENVVSSSQLAIYVQNSKRNRIYKNDFLSNTAQVAVADDSSNYWNTTVGNYWDDYMGSDADGDGVGDTPYVIDQSNVDYLPAVKPFFAKASESVTQPPAAGGGGGGGVEDPLSARFNELTPELMLRILEYFDVKGKAYRMNPALGAALLALRDSRMFPATGIEKVDSALGGGGEYGADVYGAVAKEVTSRFTFSSYVVVARSDIEADAYAAIAYARARNIPLLLADPHRVPEETKQVIKRLGVRRVIIIGGPKAISPEVEAELRKLAEVTRIYGETRVETSVMVAQALASVRSVDVVVVQDGWNLTPEAAIVSALYRAPVVYVRDGTLPQATKDYLRSLRSDVRVLFVNLSPEVENEIKDILG